ncbi:shikimate dehydrogenase [Thermoflexales bacterium]|nr:shikimate dehydrogenase [Thermoflexales bacterium]
MAINYKAELVGVLGYPVAENPTGVMQEAAFAALGLNWRYLTMEVKPENLADAIRGVRALGLRGINLTIPHKVAVMALLDDIAPDAKVIGAVNTVYRAGDRLIGTNTDGKGFLRGLRDEAEIDPKGRRVAVLGAGGAARAITFELAFAGASELVVINRSVERGQQLVEALRQDTSAAIEFVPWSSTYVVPQAIDVLVNATSIGLYPDVEALPDISLDQARSDLFVCDVIPNPPDTRLMQLARSRGLRTLNGLSMLVHQGTIGFELWTGQAAPEAVMKEALRKAFEMS